MSTHDPAPHQPHVSQPQYAPPAPQVPPQYAPPPQQPQQAPQPWPQQATPVAQQYAPGAGKHPAHPAAIVALILLVIETLGAFVQPLFMRFGYETLGSSSYTIANVLHYIFLIAALILAIVAVVSKRSPRHPLAYLTLGAALFLLAGSVLNQLGFWFSYAFYF